MNSFHLKHPPFRLLALVLIAPLFIPALSYAEVEKVISEIKTKNGETYRNVKLGKVTPLRVSFTHETGATSKPIADLPEEIQKLLGYDPEKAKNYREAIEKGELLLSSYHYDGNVSAERVEEEQIYPINKESTLTIEFEPNPEIIQQALSFEFQFFTGTSKIAASKSKVWLTYGEAEIGSRKGVGRGKWETIEIPTATVSAMKPLRFTLHCVKDAMHVARKDGNPEVKLVAVKPTAQQIAEARQRIQKAKMKAAIEKEMKSKAVYQDFFVKQNLGGGMLVNNVEQRVIASGSASIGGGGGNVSFYTEAGSSIYYIRNVTGDVGAADGDLVTFLVAPDGTYEYTTVLGATATVKAFRFFGVKPQKSK
ncbi:MAG: hypothetical protein ACQKBY_00140 [Verrucomicrobiales bacterium]